jgi:hypothetical protein
MSVSGSKSLPALGFLTIREIADGGFCGGYLVLNASGRPLEFHCTAPVAPNRAQQILYGPTLKPFLFGEQIGQTLVGRSKAAPLLVMTDCEEALALRAYCETPLVCVLKEGDERLGRTPVAVDRGHARDLEQARTLWSQHFQTLDLCEPFERIAEALEESRRVA